MSKEQAMTTIAALEGAIESLRAFERARDAQAEREQHEIRALSAAVRNTRQKSHPASIDQGFAPAAPDRGPMLPPGSQPNREQP